MDRELKAEKPFPWGMLHRLEQGLGYASLICLTLLPVADAFARIIFKTGIPASNGLMIHCLLVVGLISGMLTTKTEEHLSIGLVATFGNPKTKERFMLAHKLLSACILIQIAWCGASFVLIGLSPWRMIGFIPNQIFGLIIPLGYAVMAFRFAANTALIGKAKVLPVLALLLGTLCALPMLAKICWGFDVPDRLYAFIDFWYTLAYYLRVPGVILLLLAALAGTPLFVVMGGLALLLIQSAGGEVDVVANQVYTTLTKDSFIAIPLFTLVGFFLSESKAGERLVHTFRSLFSWLPGGMIIATVLICAFFASFTGASGVTILALGGILYTVLTSHVQYPQRFSIGLLTSVGSIGLLFPPSIPIILVGTASMTNVFHMFLGGIIPGLILVAGVIIFGIIASIKTKIPVEPFKPSKALAALQESAFEILLPVLLIGGYFSGLLSLIETGGVAVLYIFMVEVFIHRDIPLRDLGRVFSKAIPIIGGVLSILALAQALSYYIVDTQAPEALVRWMQSAIKSKYLFLLFLNLSLLVVGCLMDIFSAILIVLPLILPLGTAYGIDPVHLGIIFITNLEVGFLTPPVGMNLFLAAYRFNTPFAAICRYVFPFLLIQFAVVLLVTYVPWFSTFLPHLLASMP
ncbi:MAG: TRAP transporter large permease subunit [Treponema sp.]|jgi:tripartite ATP-independent transporter DctM subunit|nr:TRAP transporter large permease subunit [Treponema sp.]